MIERAIAELELAARQRERLTAECYGISASNHSTWFSSSLTVRVTRMVAIDVMRPEASTSPGAAAVVVDEEGRRPTAGLHPRPVSAAG